MLSIVAFLIVSLVHGCVFTKLCVFCLHVYIHILTLIPFILVGGGLVAKLCPTLCHSTDCSPPDSSYPWDFPGKNTGVGCRFLLQKIFTPGLNPHLLHWQVDSLLLSHQGSNLRGNRKSMFLLWLKTLHVITEIWSKSFHLGNSTKHFRIV